MGLEKCKHIECSEKKLKGWQYCEFHNIGGILGNGEAFDQYQIIEQDFIDFIKIVPIDNDYHLKVSSPVLNDIIIRSCVQIEIFFKEWAKFEFNNIDDNSLSKAYFKVFKKEKTHRGERNWNFGAYFYFFKELEDSTTVFIRPRNEKLEPFLDWESEKKPPKWWSAYNSIKHSGVSSKDFATLENAMLALSALFALHCSNRYSRDFLSQYKNYTVSPHINDVKIKFHNFTSPIDTKRYLFKTFSSSQEKEIDLITKDKLEKPRSILWD